MNGPEKECPICQEPSGVCQVCRIDDDFPINPDGIAGAMITEGFMGVDLASGPDQALIIKRTEERIISIENCTEKRIAEIEEANICNNLYRQGKF